MHRPRVHRFRVHGSAVHGFTLLEILLVLLIIGILMAVLTPMLARTFQEARLREAAQQVATEFRRARSTAQRQSVDMLVGASGGATYTINNMEYTVPNNMTLTCVQNCAGAAFTFTAPFGELAGGLGRVFEVRSPVNSISPMQIRLVGVTGKVMVARANP